MILGSLASPMIRRTWISGRAGVSCSVVAVGLAGCTQCGDNLPDPEARDVSNAVERPALRAAM
jgi:hypothetical protein